MTSTAAADMRSCAQGHRPASVVRPSSIWPKAKARRRGTNLAIKVLDAVARSVQPEACETDTQPPTRFAVVHLHNFALATGLMLP